MRDNKGRTALHFAAYCGNGLAMRKIIEYCPDCSELVDHKGRNALHYTTSLERGQLPFIGRLRAAEVFMDRQQLRNMHNEKDNDGNTLLHLLARYASTWKEYHFHHLLKENTKVDTMAFNKNNQTALDVAYDNVPSTSQYENLFLRKLQQKVRARFGESHK
ncbi:ankyrin repeat-containing protein At5g02620-like [Prosopis cineraria]|uniref:ankyrin repeat-containing protein At5g02620-like n=1 Tax=Prosopis cineraria TaxID=364024 RepID=UPI00240EB947|nr:ankyrin repeat-containing protein At5g02620-like [Prosopis cineraria]